MLRGIPASLGIASGKVCKILSINEVGRMKSGKILVTNMTSPEFVPAMSIASAIVTDEGGITSHAAIVSRELGIPCVVGTKKATKLLKDGDTVMVDANTGTINILGSV